MCIFNFLYVKGLQGLQKGYDFGSAMKMIISESTQFKMFPGSLNLPSFALKKSLARPV